MSAGAPSPDSRHACSPSASDRRCLELPDAGGEPDGAFVGGEQVGLQGCAADGGPAVSRRGRRGGFGRVDLLQQVAVPVEEGAVDAGGAGDAATH